MGLAGRRRPPLPAPTDSSIGAFDRDSDPESDSPPPIEPSDLETNLTTRTDKTHYSIPEDGSPIVIKTDKLRGQPKNLRLKDKSAGNTSQTSLLIEYFEGDKEDESGNRKPSVRVRVTPSSKKSNAGGGAAATPGSIRVTERNRGRNSSYSRNIQLGGEGVGPLEESNISSLAGSDLTAAPVEIDLRRNNPESDFGRDTMAYGGEESRLAPINMSEVSSMPPDSMLATDLGLESPTKPLSRRRSRSLERDIEIEDGAKLKPGVERSKSLSRERLVAKKAVEQFQREDRERKLKEKEREGGSHRRKSSRSASSEYLASTSGKSRRKSSKSYDRDDDISNPSLLAGSNVSGQSAQTTSSISKNPKLLQTVEDAIRRLILPEITALKNEQKSQRRSDRYDDELSSNASSVRSEGKTSRRVSSGKGGPKLKLNGDTIKSSRSSRRSGERGSVDSLKREFERPASEETVVRDEKSRRRSKDKAARDVALGAAAAGLTYAALQSKDSASSIERRERRKKRSKSHSRSQSRADSVEDMFNKHDVPPMPMTSGLTDSDLTRDSILSERTSTPTHDRNREVRDLVRDNANEVAAKDRETPTRDMSPGLEQDDELDDDYHHHRYDEGVHLRREPADPHMHDDYLEEEDDEYADEQLDSGYAPGMGMYSNANYSSPSYRYQRRGLSPIQSVSSFEERGEAPPDHLREQQSMTSMSSAERDLNQERSMDSISSGTAEQIKRKSLRPKSIHMEDARDVLHGHQTPGREAAALLGQDIQRLGANPELVDTPHRAESAVASLLGDRSNLSYGSNDQNSQNKRYSAETDLRRASFISQERNLHTPERSSPLKREIRHDDFEDDYHQHHTRPSDMTPSRDVTGYSARSSPFDVQPKMHSSALPTGSPMPEVGMYDDEVETNPSEIRDDPWDHKEAQHSGSTHDSLRAAANNMLLAAGVAGAGAAIVQHQKDEHPREYDDFDSPRHTEHSESPGIRDLEDSPMASKKAPELAPWTAPSFTPLQPLGGKDEGYVSGVRRVTISEGSLTPEPEPRAKGLFQGIDTGGDVANDPFTSPKVRPTTADSSAMPSPLFDAATGRGMDRIKNQDIVALMDHLTVRDAQRNARDTEILVTLVRSAAEMRNSFEDMKRIMASQEEKVIDANNKQHMETRRAINGPRAMPVNKSISSKAASAADMNPDDIPAKRRNLFRKALRGLGGGGSKQDLSNIENMLMQLLDEVAEIRAVQQAPSPGGLAPVKTSSGLTSYEQLRDAPAEVQADAYQPPGPAPAVHNDPGHASTNPSYRAVQHPRRTSGAFNFGGNRVSTVHEDDEEDESPESPLDEREQNILGNDEADEMLTPTREFRGVTVTTGAPQANHQQSLSADNTPSTRKNRIGSGFSIPKISRWSKTTASTVPGLDQTPRQDAHASFSQQQTPSKSRGQRPVSELSRSASDLAGDYDVRDHYDPHGDDRIRSKTSLSNHSTSREMRPPSPLIPSTVSEKPTYSAHRDSKDLQHPQPRQGPTARYQNHLEAEARGWLHADNIESPGSDVMGHNPVLSRFGGGQRGDRTSYASAGAQGAEELGTIVEGASSNAGPARPPKVREEGPLVPPKVPVEQNSSGGRTVQFATDRMAQIIGTQGRKPSGPRPITRTGSASPAHGQSFSDWKKHHIPVGPDHVPSDDESETF